MTVPFLNACSPTSLKLVDSQSVIRSLTPSITGNLTYDGSTLVDLTYLSNNYSTTTSINNSLALKADDAAVTTAFAGVQVQLAGKQDSLTASTGIFMSGTTISSYGLRRNTNSTPTIAIEDLHFQSGLTVSESLNISSGKNELVIEHPSSHPISMITGLQMELNKLGSLVDGVSGVSMGSASTSQRMAVYEGSFEHYFYGMGLFLSNVYGLGLWGGSGAGVPTHSSAATGVNPHLFIANGGNVGIGEINPTSTLHVNGDITCSGTITGTTKSFDIKHPDPTKAAQGFHMRHWCLETADSPGGSLIYRRTIDMTSTNETLQLPDWFSHLAKDVTIHMTPFEHFGSAWGRCVGKAIEVHSTTLGKWHVLILANRNDDCTNMCPQEVEYIPDAPPDNGARASADRLAAFPPHN